MKSLLKITTALMLLISSFNAFAQTDPFEPPAETPINESIVWLAITGIIIGFVYFYKSRTAVKN